MATDYFRKNVGQNVYLERYLVSGSTTSFHKKNIQIILLKGFKNSDSENLNFNKSDQLNFVSDFV